MSVKEEYVFRQMASGEVCVFPSEVSARGYLVSYARKRGAIFAEKAISYDAFCKLFSPTGDREQATDTIRYLFLHDALMSGRISLPYFVPRKEEATKRLIRYLSTLLPQLKLFHDRNLDHSIPSQGGMARDYETLYAAYQEYLSQQGLFEPEYEDPVIPQNHETYRILFPGALPGFSRLFEQLGCPDWIVPCPFTGVQEKPPLYLYANHVTEIRSTLRKIHELLSQKVPARDILISTARAEVMVPLLEEEAARYDVSLVTHVSQNPLSYPAGRIFQMMEECYQRQMAYGKVEALLLEPGLPYDPEKRNLSEQLLQFAIEKVIDQGDNLSSRDDLWMRELEPSIVRETRKDERIIGHYAKLKSFIISIATAENATTFLTAFHAFQDYFFIPGGWKGRDDEEVATFCIDKINALQKEIDLSGKKSVDSFLSLLIEYLQRKPYTRQKLGQMGVDVYRWTDSAALDVPYHFFLAMDWDGTQRIDKPLSCLPETVDSSVRMEEDMTSSYLEMAASGHAVLSYHQANYGGECMAPAWFDHVIHVPENKDIDGREVTDPWWQEMGVYKSSGKGHGTSLQRSALEKAEIGGLLDPYKAPDKVHAFTDDDPKFLRVSESALDKFHKCPFSYMSKYVLGAEKQTYEIGVIDDRVIGHILHKAFEKFYHGLLGKPFLQTQDMMEGYKQKLAYCFEDAVDFYLGKGNPVVIPWVVQTYLPLCLQELEREAELFPQGVTLETESRKDKEITVDGTQLTLTGVIDRVFNTKDGLLAVVDYKKKGDKLKVSSMKKLVNVGIPEMSEKLSSIQLPLYDKLKEGNVGVACYYSVEDGKFAVLWSDTEAPDMKECGEQVLERWLSAYLGHLKDGAWEFTADTKNCQDCDHRSICRRRYSTL